MAQLIRIWTKPKSGKNQQDTKGTNNSTLLPEYVKIFGIPFTFLPFESDSSSKPLAVTPSTLIRSVNEKKEYMISWPNVLRINRTMKPTLTLEVSKIKFLDLDPEDMTTSVDMAEVIDGKPNLLTMTGIDLEKAKKIRIYLYKIFQGYSFLP